jgi:hypothetical protein
MAPRLMTAAKGIDGWIQLTDRCADRHSGLLFFNLKVRIPVFDVLFVEPAPVGDLTHLVRLPALDSEESANCSMVCFTS